MYMEQQIMHSEVTPMDKELSAYITANLHQRPDGRTAVKELIDGFCGSLPSDRERKLWPRWRIVKEVQRQYQTAVGPGGRLYVLGLSYEPSRKWAVMDGRARLVPA